MTAPVIHVFGGTSDARALCQALDEAGERYRLSVASEAGRQMAEGLGGEVVVGRLDADAMTDFLRAQGVRWAIDASHPYAEELSRNIDIACRRLALPLTRYQRPSDIDAIDDPLLLKVDDVEEACAAARALGPRVLLNTGSKQLAQYRRGLPDKHLLVRVLPTSEVLAQCEALGLEIGQIVALCGPFSADFNRELYRLCRPDVVITKESGAEGGYRQKVAPCLALGIPCIVVRRPAASGAGERIGSIADFRLCLERWRRHERQAGNEDKEDNAA